MSRSLRTLLLIIAVLATFMAQGQIRRVTTVNPMSPDKSAYIDVYEYDYVDIRPQFPGGERGLINFINETREYPYNAYKKGIEGRVVCSFVVGTDGKVSHIEVIRGANDETLNREAVRVISKMPRWSVGKIDGAKVPVRCVLPIAFRL